MGKGKWFYYWKTIRDKLSAFDYVFISDEDSYQDEDYLKDICEEWALNVNYIGADISFKFGFNEVKSPPKEWLDKKIDELKNDINNKIMYLEFINKTRESNL